MTTKGRPTDLSARLVGRYFQGVVSGSGLSPDATQDVAKVNSERARVMVADGAGDTGAAAGDWASVLSLCYSMSRHDAPGHEPEWLTRALEVWSRATKADGESVNMQELALLQRGVEASFVAGSFSEGETLSLNWVAAGDCEVLLVRDDRLLDWGPIRTAAEFTSVPGGMSSLPRYANPQLQRGEWALQKGDTLLFTSDALACFLLQSCGSEIIPEEVRLLLTCTEWHQLRSHVERWRGSCEPHLRNDDVAIVRITIDELPGRGRFSLIRDTAQDLHFRRPVVEGVPDAHPLLIPGDGRGQTELTVVGAAVDTSTPATLFHRRATSAVASAGWSAELGKRVKQLSFSGLIGLGLGIAIGTSLTLGGFRQGVSSDAKEQGASDASERMAPSAPKAYNSSPGVALSIPGSENRQQREDQTTATPDSTQSVAAKAENAPAPSSGTAEKKIDSNLRGDCLIRKGEALFAGPVAGKRPLLIVEASKMRCTAHSPPDSAGGLTISVWLPLPANAESSAMPVWVESLRLPQHTNVWTSPRGESGSEYVGNLGQGTRFTLTQKRVHEEVVWLNLKVVAFRGNQ